MTPGMGLKAGNLLAPLLGSLGAGLCSSGAPESALALAPDKHCFSKCGPRTVASP